MANSVCVTLRPHCIVRIDDRNIIWTRSMLYTVYIGQPTWQQIANAHACAHRSEDNCVFVCAGIEEWQATASGTRVFFLILKPHFCVH